MQGGRRYVGATQEFKRSAGAQEIAENFARGVGNIIVRGMRGIGNTMLYVAEGIERGINESKSCGGNIEGLAKGNFRPQGETCDSSGEFEHHIVESGQSESGNRKTEEGKRESEEYSPKEWRG